MQPDLQSSPNLQAAYAPPVSSPETFRIREGVGVFDTVESLDAAVAALEAASFDRHEISVLGTSSVVDDPAHPERSTPYSLAENPNAPRSILVMPEEKALGIAVLVGGGAYAGATSAVLAAVYFADMPADMTTWAYLALIVAGGIVGAALGGLIAKLVRDKFQRDVERQMRRGGLVLWVRIFDSAKWETARRIMKRNGGHNVHLHHIPA